MRKLLIAFMFVIALFGIASADIAYTTTDGKLGLIKIEGPKSPDLAGIQYNIGANNSVIGSYWDNGQSRLIVISTNGSSDDKALIFNSSGLTTPINSEPITLTGAKNVRKILSTSTGKGFYLIYGASIQEFATENFAPLDRKYTSSGDIDIMDAVIRGVEVYVLVDDSILVFDGQLKDSGKNYEKYSVAEGSEMLAYISGVGILIGHKNGVQVLSSEAVDFLTTRAPIKSICGDNSSGFYYITQDVSDDVYQNTLYHYNGANTDEILNFEGEIAELILDTNYDVLAVIASDKIQLYNIENDTALVTEYSSADLGGNPHKLAGTTITGETQKKDGSCNLSGLGILLALCFAIIVRNHNSILEGR